MDSVKQRLIARLGRWMGYYGKMAEKTGGTPDVAQEYIAKTLQISDYLQDLASGARTTIGVALRMPKENAGEPPEIGGKPSG